MWFLCLLENWLTFMWLKNTNRKFLNLCKISNCMLKSTKVQAKILKSFARLDRIPLTSYLTNISYEVCFDFISSNATHSPFFSIFFFSCFSERNNYNCLVHNGRSCIRTETRAQCLQCGETEIIGFNRLQWVFGESQMPKLMRALFLRLPEFSELRAFEIMQPHMRSLPYSLRL